MLSVFYSAMSIFSHTGQGMVRLTAKCQPGACVPDQATFTDQVQIQVIPPLKLLRPANGHFLLPNNGRARIVTNRDGISRLSYQLLLTSGMDKQDLVSVSPLGEVQTGAVNGHAIIMVTAHEEDLGLNQTVAVHIEVRVCVCVCMCVCVEKCEEYLSKLTL